MNTATGLFSSFTAPRGNSQFGFQDLNLSDMGQPQNDGQGGDQGGQGAAGNGGQEGAGGSQQGGGDGQGSQQGGQQGGQPGGQQQASDGGQGASNTNQQGGQSQQGQGAGQGQQQGQGGQGAGQGQGQQQGQQGQGGQGQQGGQQNQQGQGGNAAPDEAARLAAHNEAVTALQPYIEQGIFIPDEKKEYDLSNDAGMAELMRDTALGHVRNFVNGMTDTAREFFLAAYNGATREEMRQLAMMDVHLPDYSQYDLTKPEHVDAILRATASSQLGEGATSDSIDAVLTQYKALPDSVRANIAEQGKKMLINNVNAQRAEITRTAAARQDTERRQAAERQQQEVELIRKTANIAGFPLSQADQEALIKFRYERNAEGHTPRELALTPENTLAADYFLMKGFDTSKLAGKPAASIAGWLKLTGNKGGGGAGAAASGGNATSDQAAHVDQALQALGGHSYSALPSRQGAFGG